jgi:hypothetical protein
MTINLPSQFGYQGQAVAAQVSESIEKAGA